MNVIPITGSRTAPAKLPQSCVGSDQGQRDVATVCPECTTRFMSPSFTAWLHHCRSSQSTRLENQVQCSASKARNAKD
jgi:hypothetical protein